MKRELTLATLLAAAVLLLAGACSDDDSPSQGIVFKIRGTSGNLVTITGLWDTGCTATNGGVGPGSERFRMTVQGVGADYIYDEYTVASCGGTPTTTTDTLVFDDDGDQANTPWADTQPAGLAASYTVSRVRMTLNPSGLRYALFLVDDTVASVLTMYQNDDPAGYPTAIASYAPVIKQ